MTAELEVTEISPAEFRAAIERELRLDEHEGAVRFFWSFADMHYVATELGDLRIETWCGKREAEVWTRIELVDAGETIGLDTLAAGSGDDAYPPSMSGSWTPARFVNRIRLESMLIRRHVLSGLDRSLFDSMASRARPDAVRLDDPVALFVQRCTEQLDPLGAELGLVREYDQMGAGVLYRGDPFSIRVCLLETILEDDEEEDWSVVAELVESPGRSVPPLFLGGEELEIEARQGRFSQAYLELALAEAEQRIRAELARRGSRG